MRLTAPLLVVTLALACKKGPDPAEVIKQHRPAAQKTLDNAVNVLAKVEKEPAASDDDALPDDAPDTSSTSDEVVTEQIENLRRLEDDTAKGPRMDIVHAGRVSQNCAKILKTKEVSNAAAADMEKCAKARYILVVRVRDYTAPTKGSGKTFTPGEASGDAVLYRLATAKKVGAFAFSAKSSEKVGVGKSVAEFDLRKDLENAVVRALAEGGRKGKSKPKQGDDDE